jgi:hypothetical protein
MKKENKKLGELLLELGLIDEFQLRAALSEQARWGGRVGSIMIKKGFVSEKDMLAVIEKQYGLSAISLDSLEKPSDEVLKMVGMDVARKFGICPVGLEGKTLLIAITDPTDLKAIDDIGFSLGVRVKPLLALESDIMRAIGIYYEGKSPVESFRMAKERLEEFESLYATEGSGGRAVAPGTGSGGEALKPKTDISQKAVIESLIDLLVSKGIISREELLKKIKSKGRS